jgi:hypothetical protein
MTYKEEMRWRAPQRGPPSGLGAETRPRHLRHWQAGTRPSTGRAPAGGVAGCVLSAIRVKERSLTLYIYSQIVRFLRLDHNLPSDYPGSFYSFSFQ